MQWNSKEGKARGTSTAFRGLSLAITALACSLLAFELSARALEWLRATDVWSRRSACGAPVSPHSYQQWNADRCAWELRPSFRTSFADLIAEAQKQGRTIGLQYLFTDNHNVAIRQIARRQGWGVIDLEPWATGVLHPRDAFFIDSVHLTEAGQEMIGVYMAAELLPLIPRTHGASDPSPVEIRR